MHRAIIGYGMWALVVMVGAGCGSSTPGPKWPDPVPVTGKVMYQGKPLAHASIMFVPDLDTIGPGAGGFTDASGTFTVQTRWAGQIMREGAIPGRYKVAVSRFVKPDGTVWEPNPEEGPASSGAMEEIPPQYSDPNQTQFQVEVAVGDNQPMELVLQ